MSEFGSCEANTSSLSQNSSMRRNACKMSDEQEISNESTIVYETQILSLEILFSIIGFLLLLDFYIKIISPSTIITNIEPPELTCDFLKLSSMYPKQDKNLWISLKVGISSVLKNNQPNTFLLVYEDEELPNGLLQKIIDVTRICLGNEDVEPLMLTDKDFTNDEFFNDYGLAIEKYKKPLEESGIMVIEHLNKIPSRVAQVFHSFCDTHSPLVNKAIVFFSLPIKINQINNGRGNNINYLVQETLNSLWKEELSDNVLQPLITRVSEMILLLKAE